MSRSANSRPRRAADHLDTSNNHVFHLRGGVSGCDSDRLTAANGVAAWAGSAAAVSDQAGAAWPVSQTIRCML